MHRHAQLFLLTGLWLSFVALALGGSTLLPDGKKVRDESPALLYKIALNGEIRHPNVPLGGGKTIVADLTHMRLSLYEDATPVESFAILAKGRDDTFWQTPRGSYVVQTKEIRHFSPIANTWMPYSVQFYGNFFIHGWPTSSDGRDVASDNLNGCIRLSTDDAEKVYDFSSTGTKVFVIDGTAANVVATSSRYYLRGGGGLPQLSTQNFFVADIDNSAVLWERGAQVKKDPGNLISLLTALTALETVDQYKKVHMSDLLLRPSVSRKYSVGSADEVPMGALIYPLLFDRNNTAAKVFAREYGTKQFIAHMNERSATIGMSNSVFSGALSTDNGTTTAYDLFQLLHYVDKEKPFLLDATLADGRTLTDENGVKRYSWENKNPWILKKDGTYRGGVVDVRDDGSGSALVLFELPLSEFDKRTIAFVVLDSGDVISDVETLRTFINEHFVFAIDASTGASIRGNDQATSSLLQKIRETFDLGKFLEGSVEYERDA